jgi:hypothetical protein
MKAKQGSPGARDPAVDLQPLAFIKTSDDGHEAVFRAKVGNIKVPDEPVLELTATVASPDGDEKAARELNAFLNEMRAGFAVTAPEPDDDQNEDQESEQFNVDNDILFEAELLRPDTHKGPVDVTTVVQTTVEGYTGLELVLIRLATIILLVSAWLVGRRARQFRALLRGSVLKGKDHQYTSKKARNTRGTVTSTSGSAKVFPGPRRINRGGSYIVTAKTITVRGVSKQKCFYRIQGDFKSL